MLREVSFILIWKLLWLLLNVSKYMWYHNFCSVLFWKTTKLPCTLQNRNDNIAQQKTADSRLFSSRRNRWKNVFSEEKSPSPFLLRLPIFYSLFVLFIRIWKYSWQYPGFRIRAFSCYASLSGGRLNLPFSWKTKQKHAEGKTHLSCIENL